jgi:peptidoglycan-associated lipoprotein
MERPQITFFTVLFTACAWAASGCGGPQYPNCQNDSHCHTGEFCVNGTCQQCRPDANDCPSGQQCMEGRCEPIEGYCTSSSDCGSGQECRENRCVTSQVTETGPVETPAACSLTAVYFGYDSSDLDPSARSALQTNAQCIQERDIPHVQLTGHTDPRGTEEYNLALGDRRARSVQGYLQNLGVDGSRVSARSMGEEMARGEDESSWSRDRRVEFEAR